MKNDVLIRALKTFWQGALAALCVSVPQICALIPEGWAALKPVLISAATGALAAGFSALYNGLIKPMLPQHNPVPGNDKDTGEGI